VNERGKVLDINGARDRENEQIILWKKHNGINQQWDVQYVDDLPKELKKGDMNKEFGMKIESDFHIVTKMGSGRFIDRVGNDVVLKTPNDRQTQIWYFDNKSKTIKNRYQNYSM